MNIHAPPPPPPPPSNRTSFIYQFKYRIFRFFLQQGEARMAIARTSSTLTFSLAIPAQTFE